MGGTEAMTHTLTESFWVLVRVVKFSSVPHFLTPTNQTSIEVRDAKRYPSLKDTTDAAAVFAGTGGWCVPKHIALTTTYTLTDTPP